MNTLRARASDHEHLDEATLDPRDLRINLREMAMLNRLPGGVGDSVRAVSGALDGRAAPSVLDIGAGSGDFARRLLRERRATVLVATCGRKCWRSPAVTWRIRMA